MARIKRYIDRNVYEEAKRRIHHIFDINDSVAVCFSGGKDSLAALHLTHEVLQARGLDSVDVIFRDEEFIPSVVVDFVQSYRHRPWVRMHYFCVPLKSSRYVLGETFEYVQWDEHRQHIRPIPKFAITLRAGEHVVLDQFTGDDYIVDRIGLAGKCALITGIRASESIMRFRASVNKLNDNYINASSSDRVSLCKPLFDWEENDIFRYFYEKQIDYCEIYNRQIWGSVNLRVATPMVSESAKHLDTLAIIDPVLYQQVVTAFPSMIVQARYHKEFKRNKKGAEQEYGQTWLTIARWIEEHIKEPSHAAQARDALKSVIRRSFNNPDSYPPLYVFKQFQNGAWKKKILPQQAR